MNVHIDIGDPEEEPYQKEIQSIYCVGQNFLEHIQELQGEIPEAPVVFMKPPTALVKSETPLMFPLEKGVVHHEVEVVLCIGKTGSKIDKYEVWDHIEAIGIGIDFTLRELQHQLRERKLPWLLSKGFDYSAGVTGFIPFSSPEEFAEYEFYLDLNGTRKQTGNVREMIFDIPTLIAFLTRTITLQEGDLLFTGTPSGVGKVRGKDKITVGMENIIQETFTVR